MVGNNGVLFNKWQMAECYFGKWQSARWFFGLVENNKVDFYWSGNQRGGKLEWWIISEAENVELAQRDIPKGSAYSWKGWRHDLI